MIVVNNFIYIYIYLFEYKITLNDIKEYVYSFFMSNVKRHKAYILRSKLI